MSAPSDDLESAIGRDAMAKVRAAGWTPPPPKPEPKRLVTMEESRERWKLYAGSARHPFKPYNWQDTWDGMGSTPDFRLCQNAADNWLVRTVNRRIIEGLPASETHDVGAQLVRTSTRAWLAHRPDLLRLFCGEEKP